MKNELYKYSQYNIIVQEKEDEILLYNTYTLNYRWMHKSDFEDIFNKSNIDLADVPIYLEQEGFIVPTSLDEIQRIKDYIQRFQKQMDYLFLSIFTTLACNYRCTYCFEKEQLCQTDYMTKETADEIISFIKRRYKERTFPKPLKIKWFGGEPLLNTEIMKYIANELKNNNIDFNSLMYTNGRLLTKDLALELKEICNLYKVVIPIDGLAPTYTRLKNCTEEDFYKTIQNIKDAEEILKIDIHINVSEASKEDVKQIVNLLRNIYRIKSNIQIAEVLPLNTKIVTEENSIVMDNLKRFSANIPKNKIEKKMICEGRRQDYYAISTKGDLYTCEYLVGQKKYSCGNIKTQTDIINRVGTAWDNDRIVNDCKDCPILPICLGHCATERYIEKIDCQREQRIKYLKRDILKVINTKPS